MAIEVKTALRSDDIVDDFPTKKRKLAGLKVLDGFEPPKFGLFAFEFADSDFGRAEELARTDATDRADLACVITPGFIVEDRSSGFVPLYRMSDSGPEYARPDNDATNSVQIDGTYYPIYMLGKYKGEKFIGDPGRALLLFCMSLLQILDKEGAYAWINAYAHTSVRSLQTL